MLLEFRIDRRYNDEFRFDDAVVDGDARLALVGGALTGC